MFELVKIIGLIWDFYDNTNLLIRIFKTSIYYFKILFWFLKNPKVKIKYSRVIYIEGKNYRHSINKIYNKLQAENYEFSDGILKQDNQLIFEFKDTRAGYKIRAYPLKESSHNLKISTIFYNVFPFREIGTINDIKKDFYKLCDTLSEVTNKNKKNETIFLEMPFEKNIKSEFDFRECNINFNNGKIQIDNTYGEEFSQLIIFIVTKWLVKN